MQVLAQVGVSTQVDVVRVLDGRCKSKKGEFKCYEV